MRVELVRPHILRGRGREAASAPSPPIERRRRSPAARGWPACVRTRIAGSPTPSAPSTSATRVVAHHPRPPRAAAGAQRVPERLRVRLLVARAGRAEDRVRCGRQRRGRRPGRRAPGTWFESTALRQPASRRGASAGSVSSKSRQAIADVDVALAHRARQLAGAVVRRCRTLEQRGAITPLQRSHQRSASHELGVRAPPGVPRVAVRAAPRGSRLAGDAVARLVLVEHLDHRSPTTCRRATRACRRSPRGRGGRPSPPVCQPAASVASASARVEVGRQRRADRDRLAAEGLRQLEPRGVQELALEAVAAGASRTRGRRRRDARSP